LWKTIPDYRKKPEVAESKSEVSQVNDRRSCPTTSPQASAAKSVASRVGDKCLERLGWPVVVSVAVGQRETTHPFWVERGENLADSAPTIVTNKIDLLDLEGVEKLLEHVRVGCDRDILIRMYFCVTVGEQIDGDTPPNLGQMRKLVAPEMTVKQDAVHKQGDRPLTLLDITNTARWGLNMLSLRETFVLFHGLASPSPRERVRFLQLLRAVRAANLY
jgi:hypothetical protein